MAAMDLIYKKNALPGFSDKSNKGDSIDIMADELTKVIYNLFRCF
jgi:hypothetical protein